MYAFIVRPFGEKQGIDFDRVERELIDPVLRELGIEGRTTAEIARAGNIREDMFELLITADLVIADISVHNANVFYELGIRHALRHRPTILLRCRCDEVPFDLRTDRYQDYDAADPGATVAALRRTVRDTLNGDAKDSPVYLLLPKLEPPDPSNLLAVPQGFTEAVQRAQADGKTGDLGLLAEEAERFRWAIPALRLVGSAQFARGAREAARESWEWIRRTLPNDVEANGRLATIYQKLGDLTQSDQAVVRVISHPTLKPEVRAESLALHASNAKTRWVADWWSLQGEERRAAALGSPWLYDAYERYSEGFEADRNHFYSGLNALAMLWVIVELARALPAVWAGRFETDEDAAADLRKREKVRGKLSHAVDLALEAGTARNVREGRRDRWTEISVADFASLTSAAPLRVKTLYEGALRDAQDFHFATARRQLEIFSELGVLAANAAAGLGAIDSLAARGGKKQAQPQSTEHVLVFTGHRIDAPGRPAPRFPAAAEERAREMIREAVLAEQAASGGTLVGLAGAASGGDILFHEVCEALGIRSEVFLAGPRDEYVAASVQDAGPEWVRRFDRLCRARRPRMLHDRLELPGWLQSLQDYTIWQRNNLWTLHNGLVHGADRVTLIALWDRKVEDGPGGTAHMVKECERRGARVVVLDAAQLATKV